MIENNMHFQIYKLLGCQSQYFYRTMNFQIKRVASSTEKKPTHPQRRWLHTNKITTLTLLNNNSNYSNINDHPKFYISQRSTMAYSSVQFKTKIRTKGTMQSIMLSASSSFNKLNISSRSWCLYDEAKDKYLGFREKSQREIASLTKIMTTILSVQLMEKYQINPELHVKVTDYACKMIGTSAQLRTRTWVKFRDLLYGAMLPSGNDAAYLLSQIVGYLSKTDNMKMRNIKFLDICNENTTLCTVQFVKMMNKKAEEIGMEFTQFSNPHGLQNAMNVSCPKDLIKLSSYAAKNGTFRRIMNTQVHKYEYFQLVVEEGESKQKVKISRHAWNNTNTLLKKGWEGVKTGQTGPAGSCLSSLKDGIFIVVLNCKDRVARFTDTESIYAWYMNKKKSSSTDDEDLGDFK